MGGESVKNGTAAPSRPECGVEVISCNSPAVTLSAIGRRREPKVRTFKVRPIISMPSGSLPTTGSCCALRFAGGFDNNSVRRSPDATKSNDKQGNALRRMVHSMPAGLGIVDVLRVEAHFGRMYFNRSIDVECNNLPFYM
ncbi:hypothetical protein FB451DRAFT_1171014 [Mycena latifolia]|nr:hypothetical protein FB451DRAFT_1171014 [Mycena latifolia]